MEVEKQKLYNRVKALLAKTIREGCTEAEAEAFANKARELIEKYQLDMTKEELIEEGFTEILFRWSSRERSNIQSSLCNPIAIYTATRAWRKNDGETQQRVSYHFFGIKSDVMLAGHLMSSLSDFVIKAADEYCKTFHPYYNSKKERTSFIIGCTKRISVRLIKEQHDTIQVKQNNTSTALITIDKRQIVTQELNTKGIFLVKGQIKTKSIHSIDSYNQGLQAGNTASFSRPLEKRASSKMIQE
jgi:hypothetical protein